MSSTIDNDGSQLSKVRKSHGTMSEVDLTEWKGRYATHLSTISYIDSISDVPGKSTAGDSLSKTQPHRSFHNALGHLAVARQSLLTETDPEKNAFYALQNKHYRWRHEIAVPCPEFGVSPLPTTNNLLGSFGSFVKDDQNDSILLQLSRLPPSPKKRGKKADTLDDSPKFADWVKIQRSYVSNGRDMGLFAARQFGAGNIIGVYAATSGIQGVVAGAAFPHLLKLDGLSMTPYDAFVRDHGGCIRFYRPSERTIIHNNDTHTKNNNEGLFMGMHYIHSEEELATTSKEYQDLYKAHVFGHLLNPPSLSANAELLPDGFVRVFKRIEVGAEIIFGNPNKEVQVEMKYRMTRSVPSRFGPKLVEPLKSNEPSAISCGQDAAILCVAVNGSITTMHGNVPKAFRDLTVLWKVWDENHDPFNSSQSELRKRSLSSPITSQKKKAPSASSVAYDSVIDYFEEVGKKHLEAEFRAYVEQGLKNNLSLGFDFFTYTWVILNEEKTQFKFTDLNGSYMNILYSVRENSDLAQSLFDYMIRNCVGCDVEEVGNTAVEWVKSQWDRLPQDLKNDSFSMYFPK